MHHEKCTMINRDASYHNTFVHYYTHYLTGVPSFPSPLSPLSPPKCKILSHRSLVSVALSPLLPTATNLSTF